MKLVCFCIAANAVSLDQIYTMEIETLLHSGGSNPYSSFAGVFVSKREDVEKNNYFDVLKSESRNQVYRFLTELGISRVEIAPSTSEFSVEEFKIPSRFDIMSSVEEMNSVLRNLHLPSNIMPWNMVDYLDMMPRLPRLNAVRRFNENIFLLKGFKTLKARFNRLPDTEPINMHRTQMEELDAVFELLFLKHRAEDLWADNFDLHLIDVFMPFLYDTPLKLIVPHDQSESILDFVLCDPNAKRKIGPERIFHLSRGLHNLRTRYERQVVEYAAFADINPLCPQMANDRSLFSRIQHVWQLRRRALRIYENFRFPFPHSGSPSFFIYAHDPEYRGATSVSYGRPCDNIFDALQFYRAVASSFERVSGLLYSGVLQNVVLYQADPTSTINGEVACKGRHMILVQNAFSPYTLDDIILHECGHIFDHKLHCQLESKLGAIVSSRYTRQVRKCIMMMVDVLLPYNLPKVRFTDSNRDNERLSYTINHFFDFLNLLQSGTKELEGTFSKGELTMVVHEFNKLERHEWDLLREMRDVEPQVNDRTRELVLFGFTTAGDDSKEFTSVYSTWSVAEEAAELVKQLAHPRVRAGLFTEYQYNTAKREKIELALNVFADPKQGRCESRGDTGRRAALVKIWRAELHLLTRTTKDRLGNFSGRYTVVLVSELGNNHFDALTKADAFVRTKILEGNRVSFLHLLQQDGILPRTLVLQKSVDPFVHAYDRYKMQSEIVFFNVDRAGMYSAISDLESALVRTGLDFDGRPTLRFPEWNDIMSDARSVSFIDCGIRRYKFTF